MTPDEMRAIMGYLRERVRLEPGTPPAVAFQAPMEQEMLDAGLNAEGVKRLLAVPWWGEMVTDVVETPSMCDPADPPEQVLAYARDVVEEYLRKRFPLNAG
jgi:hypothetical protein